jgi:hypothetical protein
MTITRREIISVGLPGLAKASSLPISYDKSDSPILSIQKGEKAFLLRLMKDRDHYYMSSIVALTPTKQFSTLEKAENYILQYHSIFVYKHVESESHLPFLMRAQAAYVAHDTRQGFGNTLLMHPSLAARITEPLAPVKQNIGRWTHAGGIWKHVGKWSIDLYTSKNLPPNEFYVLYKNGVLHAEAAAIHRDTYCELFTFSEQPCLYIRRVKLL